MDVLDVEAGCESRVSVVDSLPRLAYVKSNGGGSVGGPESAEVGTVVSETGGVDGTEDKGTTGMKGDSGRSGSGNGSDTGVEDVGKKGHSSWKVTSELVK